MHRKKYLIAFAAAAALSTAALRAQTTILWSSTSGAAWLTGTNWTGSAVPTATQVAQFGANPTGTNGAGINFNGTTNAGTQTNGQKIQELAAIEITSARTNAHLIGNSSGTAGATGTLRLNGTTVNSVANVVVYHGGNASFTIQNTQSSGNQTMAVALNNSTDNVVYITGAGNVTISSVIKDGGTGNKLTLAGTGTGVLTLSGTNTYTGNTTINGSTLRLGASNVIADAVNVIVNSINAGATALFDLNNNSDTINALTFGGTGATSTSTNNLSTGAGTLTLGGTLTYDATNNPLGSTLSGNLALGGNRTFAIADSSNATTDLAVSANITGSGIILTKTGAGTLGLSGSNTYSGGTLVSAGTLAASSSNAFGSGITTIDNTGTVTLAAGLNVGSNFTINSGGTLRGLGAGATLGGIVNGPGGTLAGTLTLASGGSIAPGSSPGLLNISGATTFASGSTYTWELNAFSTTSPGTNFDQVIVGSGGSLTLSAGALLAPTFTGTATSPSVGNSFWNTAQTWTVATNSGGTITGTAFTVNNTAWSDKGSFAASLGTNEVLLTWTPSAIPEPSTYAAIIGALALGGATWRRRGNRNIL